MGKGRGDDGDAKAGPAPIALFDKIARADPEADGDGAAPVASFDAEQLGAARPDAPIAEFGVAAARRAGRRRRPAGAVEPDPERTEPTSPRGRNPEAPARRRRRHPSFGVPILPVGSSPSTDDHRSRSAARRRRSGERDSAGERGGAADQFELLSGGAPADEVDAIDRSVRIGLGGGLVNGRVADSDRAEWQALARLAEKAQARSDRARALRIAAAKAVSAGRTTRVDYIQGGVRVGSADGIETSDAAIRDDHGHGHGHGHGEHPDPDAAAKGAAATPSTRDLADLWARTLAEQRQRLSGDTPEPPLGPDGTPDFGPYADPVSIARNICLRMLTERARTRHELADALRRKGVPEEAARAVLERFSDVGLIDDAAFAEQWVRSRHAGRGLGRRALAVELRRKGVGEELAGAVLETLDDEAEELRARQLVDRKLRTMALDNREQRAAATRRLAGMLARKGYGAGIAYRVVREAIAAHGADADELGGADDPADDLADDMADDMD
jgi:SOS response regulatory protein OraA/RecX